MNPAVHANPARVLRQDIVDQVLLKDLPSRYRIGDTPEQMAMALVNMLCWVAEVGKID